MAQLTPVYDKIYDNRRIKVDGGRFIRCRFTNSKIIYYGTEEVSFEECSFQECDWIFEEAADQALRYLAMLYKQGGAEGVGVVEAAFETIRSEFAMERMTALAGSR